jgi:biotin carboxylase
MKKLKLLILNGSHSEIPLIQAGKKLGFHLITTGNEPSLTGHKFACEYHEADYSDKEKILQLAKQLDIDRICSCANDFGIITAAYVAEKMKLPGHDSLEVTELLHHKDSFKRFALENNLPTPYADCFDTREAALGAVNKFSLPVIIKPIDLSGGKGISTVSNITEYEAGIVKAFKSSREKRIVVEDFFSGTQHSFSTFVVNQKVVFYFSDNEYSFLNPYFVSYSAAPATNADLFAQTLIDAVETTAEKLRLADGVFHIQYLANETTAQIIDITRRCSGDLYPYPVNHSTGIDWAEWIVRAEAGLSCADFPKVSQSGFCGRFCVMSERSGKIKTVTIDDSIRKHIYDEIFWWKTGDEIHDFLTQKAGILFLRFDTMEEMLDITSQLTRLVRIELH